MQAWLEAQLTERRTEPNSGLGQAIGYLLRHWLPLTLFLRTAGAPLDNNIVERALKRAVLHRKNALYYRTLHGAEVGDLFMSLIHTCQLCGTTPSTTWSSCSATLGNWPPVPPNGCRGTIANSGAYLSLPRLGFEL